MGKKPVQYTNVRFVNDLATSKDDSLPLDIRPFLRSKLELKTIDGIYKSTAEGIEFEKCTFDDDLQFVNVKFESIVRFLNCEFIARKKEKLNDGREVTYTNNAHLIFDSCAFGYQFDLSATEVTDAWFSLENCSVPDAYVNFEVTSYLIIKHCNLTFTELILGGKSYGKFQDCDFDFGKNSGFSLFQFSPEQTLKTNDEAILSFEKCRLKAPENFVLTIQSNSGNVFLQDCDINLALEVSSNNQLRLGLRKNKFKRIVQPTINALSKLSDISPGGFDQFYFFPFDSASFSQTNENQPIREEKEFDKGIASLKVFYDHYKEVGNIELANLVYTRIRDIEKLKLAQRYKTDPSFNHFFGYQLSRLLKFYTNYGTDPARALVISFYIILCFGIFYFFFPSDWDVASKSRLVQNFQTFVQKNDKGYWKPFFILVFGIIISFLNAITLSLNAFTTLGFGNIPTVGIARYVCVVQGFIGWFLLSLFTVALINQAQF